MKTLISLDISSSTIGWAIFKYNKTSASLIDYGHFKPPTKKQSKDCMPYRLVHTLNFFYKLMLKYPPDEVAIEDYVKSFTKGKSSANTIIVLSTFNETVRLAAYQKMSKDVLKYPVATIRMIVGKHFNMKVVSKEDIFPIIVAGCKTFKIKLNRNQKTAKESYDEADAIACGLTSLIINEPGITQWNL